MDQRGATGAGPNILVLDNHDSFTWNLVHYLRELGAQLQVFRSDAISAADALASGVNGFLISPGPGAPDAAGISLEMVAGCAEQRRPLLGVCLGHQAIGQYFGAHIVRAPHPMHAKLSPVRHDSGGVFAGIPSPFTVARYHSLVVEEATLPASLQVTARADDGTIQGLRHRSLPIEGVQFHPESIASSHGHALLRNFLEATLKVRSPAA